MIRRSMRVSFRIQSPLLLGPVVLAALCVSPVLLDQDAPQAASKPAAPPAPEFAEMQQVEGRWDTAVGKHDQYGLEFVLAPQYIGISATGDVSTRNQEIAHMFVKGEE